MLLGDTHHLADFAQHQARLIDNILAHLSQHDLPIRPFDQRDVQLFFELLQLCGQGWLADETGGGRLPEVFVFRKRHQISEIA